MSVKIEVSSFLRPFTGNNDTVEVSGTTVRDCLDALAINYPEIQEWLFDRTGVPKTIIVVNRKIIPPNNLNVAVFDDDEISIIMPLGGG